jgi:hypothetical protein
LTLPAVIPRVTYTVAAALTPLPISNGATPIEFFDNGHIVVTHLSATGVSTALTEGTDYTITPSGFSGTVVPSGPWLPGKVSITRHQPFDQDTDLQINDRFDSQAIERTFDKGRQIDQELSDQISRAIMISRFSTASNAELPLGATGQLMRNAGNGLPDWYRPAASGLVRVNGAGVVSTLPDADIIAHTFGPWAAATSTGLGSTHFLLPDEVLFALVEETGVRKWVDISSAGATSQHTHGLWTAATGTHPGDTHYLVPGGILYLLTDTGLGPQWIDISTGSLVSHTNGPWSAATGTRAGDTHFLLPDEILFMQVQNGAGLQWIDLSTAGIGGGTHTSGPWSAATGTRAGDTHFLLPDEIIYQRVWNGTAFQWTDISTAGSGAGTHTYGPWTSATGTLPGDTHYLLPAAVLYQQVWNGTALQWIAISAIIPGPSGPGTTTGINLATSVLVSLFELETYVSFGPLTVSTAPYARNDFGAGVIAGNEFIAPADGWYDIDTWSYAAVTCPPGQNTSIEVGILINGQRRSVARDSILSLSQYFSTDLHANGSLAAYLIQGERISYDAIVFGWHTTNLLIEGSITKR